MRPSSRSRKAIRVKKSRGSRTARPRKPKPVKASKRTAKKSRSSKTATQATSTTSTKKARPGKRKATKSPTKARPPAKKTRTAGRAETVSSRRPGGAAKKAAATQAPADSDQGLRLQLIIARAGIASRREAERLITDGEVTVNGRVVRELGTRAHPSRDHVKVRGKLIQRPRKAEHWVFNKPVGMVTTMSDPQGRPCVGDVLGESHGFLFPVGRLDFHSSGLLLLTSDGELCERLTHPRYHLPKTYRVKVSRAPGAVALERLRNGVRLTDGTTEPARVRLERQDGGKAWLDITISEGRNRQVRRMLDAVGVRVEKLRRTAIGPLKLRRLATGEARRITREELADLREAVGL